ncbi:MAG: hypothetical protein JJ891_16675 [Rhizobiaceae bacterium]|nr:hypothetical protein [Rhizobiaceae bacterium]
MMDNAYDYILVMLLQRIDSGQSGLISEMISGVEADRQAIREAGKILFYYHLHFNRLPT